MALTILLMATSFLGNVFATPTPFPVGVCTAGASTSIGYLSYNVSNDQTACLNLNVSTQWRITVNVTSSLPVEGHFYASISKGLCSLGLTVYTNDSLPAIVGSTQLITIAYVPPSGLNTTVRIAYAFSGMYLRGSNVYSTYPPQPSDFIWDVYGATASLVLCQLDSDGLHTDAPATLIPFSGSTCIDAATSVRAIGLASTNIAPGNYTLILLTSSTCTSPYLLRSPPLFYTVLPGNRSASTAVTLYPTTSPSPTDNIGAIIGWVVGPLVVVTLIVIATTALVKWGRANKRALEPELIQVHPVLLPTGTAPGANIALLAMTERNPWLEEFATELASRHGLPPQPLVENCTTEMLPDILKDSWHSMVYLVLNMPSEEPVRRTIDESSFPENMLHKLVVVQLNSNGETGGGPHRNVAWIHCPPEMSAKDCARMVYSSTSMSATVLPQDGVGAPHQDNSLAVFAAMATELLSNIKDINGNVNYLVDQKQSEKSKSNES